MGDVIMITKQEVFITPFGLNRTLHIYLPDDYYQSNERYPVMYMFDGHNLFYDEDATYGKSWGLKSFLDNYDKKFIIVGLECNHDGNQRIVEFSPYTYSTHYWGMIRGKGQELMDWLVCELKPMIDSTYRTMPLRECTGIAGSSMGGLMALYSVIKYNRYFSKAACLSSAIFAGKDQLLHDLRTSKIDTDTRVYLSLGKKEVDSDFIHQQRLYDNMAFTNYFKDIGATSMLNVIEDGKHNEASWEKENKIYFDFLWK